MLLIRDKVVRGVLSSPNDRGRGVCLAKVDEPPRHSVYSWLWRLLLSPSAGVVASLACTHRSALLRQPCASEFVYWTEGKGKEKERKGRCEYEVEEVVVVM